VTAALLDGKALAQEIQAQIAGDVAEHIKRTGSVPALAAVLAGDNAASQVYVRNKRRACQRVGIASQLHELPAATNTEALLALVEQLNDDRAVHGVLVQLPLPGHIDTAAVLEAVTPVKDVDCFHPENVGRLVQGQPRFVPCTPAGIQQLLLRNGIETAGRHVVILGRSEIVGKPLANLWLQRGPGGDATVTVCHSRTRDVAAMARLADILIAAIGRPKFVTAEMVQPGAVVIDVGINRTEQGVVGDVDFEAVRECAGYITPVPGGIGPLTVTMLLQNTLRAAQLQAAGG
jgi:methylenetetrahydrofolate dehydrogenase (NADP+)/methenyltetrahydrofolate cyclohydrolase